MSTTGAFLLEDLDSAKIAVRNLNQQLATVTDPVTKTALQAMLEAAEKQVALISAIKSKGDSKSETPPNAGTVFRCRSFF